MSLTTGSARPSAEAAQRLSVHREDDRAERERYFFTYALSFFVGWGWVVVVRDVYYRVSRESRLLIEARTPGLDERAWLQRIVEVGLALAIAPLATWLVFRAKFASHGLYDHLTGARQHWRLLAQTHRTGSIINTLRRGSGTGAKSPFAYRSADGGDAVPPPPTLPKGSLPSLPECNDAARRGSVGATVSGAWQVVLATTATPWRWTSSLISQSLDGLGVTSSQTTARQTDML